MLPRQYLIPLMFTLAIISGCVKAVEEDDGNLMADSQRSFLVPEELVKSISLEGFLNFDERIEVAADSAPVQCNFATYNFQFEYETSVIVEFRDGPVGYCSYGAILVRSFEVRVLAEQEYPSGTPLAPFIQFQQSDPHIAVFQIGRDYFAEKVSDLRSLEISCWRNDCAGTVERRVTGESNKI